MKKMILLAVMMAGLAYTEVMAQTDFEKVTQTLNYYLEGGTNRDRDMVTKAFHPEATMKYIKDGTHVLVPISEFLERIKPGEKSDRKTRIVRIDITGNAAQAKVELEYEKFMFVDYFNLLKIDNEWKIVSKIFHRVEK